MTTFEEKPFEIESFYPGFTPDPGILRAYGKGICPLKKDNYTRSESVNEVQVYHYFYLCNILSVQLDMPMTGLK